jgi:hypothetical protein
MTIEGTTLERLLAILGDGEWHTSEELEAAGIHFPDAWMRVVRDMGREVETGENGYRLRPGVTR